MKAAVTSIYGSPDVLEIREVPKPQPQPDQMLVKVKATTVSRTDCGMLRGYPWFMRFSTGLFRPKLNILGMDFSGAVEAVGENVRAFQVGDAVFGLSPENFGAHAEYLCLNENAAIAIKPENLNFEQAIIGEGAWYADTYLQKFGVEPGREILIYGASGAIGTAALQLAKYYGARVTAVVGARHIHLAKSLGADQVIDFTVEGFTNVTAQFDFVFDAVGKTTFFQCRKLLKPEGVFAAADLGPWYQNLFLSTWSSINGTGRVILPMPRNTEGFIDFLKACVEAGQFRPVLDEKHYSLDRIAEAYRYVETAKKTGVVVVNVCSESEEVSSHTQMTSKF